MELVPLASAICAVPLNDKLLLIVNAAAQVFVLEFDKVKLLYVVVATSCAAPL